MIHRHLNHERFTLAAIDDAISRGRWEDWAALRRAKTADHAGLALSCSAESQSLDASHAPPSLLPDGSSWVPPRSPLLQVGE